jgi:seryl-tRNA synthetase
MLATMKCTTYVNEASAMEQDNCQTRKVRCIMTDDLYLIPTAEVPVTNLFRDVI